MRSLRQEPDQVAGRLGVVVTVAVLAITLAGVGFAALVLDCTSGTLDSADAELVEHRPPKNFGLVESSLYGQEWPERARREERTALDEYGWVDRSAEIVAIPIDVAIELYLESRASRRGRR